jgi:hypothetical protein
MVEALRDEIERQHELRDEAVDESAEQRVTLFLYGTSLEALRADRNARRDREENLKALVGAARVFAQRAPALTARELRKAADVLSERLGVS